MNSTCIGWAPLKNFFLKFCIFYILTDSSTYSNELIQEIIEEYQQEDNHEKNYQ